jgi:hypothetical protein
MKKWKDVLHYFFTFELKQREEKGPYGLARRENAMW